MLEYVLRRYYPARSPRNSNTFFIESVIIKKRITIMGFGGDRAGGPRAGLRVS
jgi:hypothetical protein